ncbi:alpha/beta hydrolase [Nocardia nepalensis]|uniref:alpha/beta hydrolase n=1 Tax=Nocardia nepalensis TaxID=3375448 RepID=UPI003B67B719
MTRLDVTFKSNGSKCRAWLYLPDAGGSHPIIVMAHGLGAVRTMRLPAYAERFHAAGYACLVFDYRHFGDSAGEPRQLIDIGHQLQDWAAALTYVRSRPDLDPERIVVWGTSFGGGHAITTAARDDAIAAAVVQCPFTDGVASALAAGLRSSVKMSAHVVRDVLASWSGRPPRLVPIAGPPHSAALMSAPDAMPGYLGLIPSDVTFRNEAAARIGLRILAYRPRRYAKHIRCPILFCICDTDSVAPPGPTRRAAIAAPRGEICSYPVGHFDIYTGDPFEHAVHDQLEFLRHHLPTT